MSDLVSNFFASLDTNQWLALAAVAAPIVLWMLDRYFGIIRALWAWNKDDRPKVDVAVEPSLLPPAPNTVNLTIEVYEEQIRARIAEAGGQWQHAEGADKERLSGQIDGLWRRLHNLKPAYDAAKARIGELEALLKREGTQLGAERLERAEAGLKAGDFDEADALFAEISAEEDLAVQRKARAEYGRGQIAEEQVRWLDAADHYKRAAELDPTYDTLIKAGTFLWRARRSLEAIQLDERLVEICIAEHGGDDPKTATALNNLAESYLAMGRFTEAEPLYRQAMKIIGATIAEDHSDYATVVNNLSGLLQAKRRDEEAETPRREATRIFPGNDENYAASLSNLALVLRAKGKPEEAKPLWEQMHSIHLEKLGPEHPQTKRGAMNYAHLLRAHFPYDPALAELKATFGLDVGKD